MNRKWFNLFVVVAMLLMQFAAALPASADGGREDSCNPPVASNPLEWWSDELVNEPGRQTDSGTITGLSGEKALVRIEAHSDAEFGCGDDQPDEVFEVTLNGYSFTVSHNTSVEVLEFEVPIVNGAINISARALGRPGSGFVRVEVVEEITPPPPPSECVLTDIKGVLYYEGNHMSGNPIEGDVTNISNDPECLDTLWLHVFGSNQEPETDGWLESQVHTETFVVKVPPGTEGMPVSFEIDTSEFCWYQADLVRTPEVRIPPYYVLPDMVDYVFVKGTNPDCEPSKDKPEKPVCPTCPETRVDENAHPATDVKVASATVLECVVTWDEDRGDWCMSINSPEAHVLRAWRQGGAFNLQLPGELWVSETHTGADGNEYSVLRVVAPDRWDFIYWDGTDTGKRIREDGTKVHEYWGPCSITVGYHDTEMTGGTAVGYWWEGHNVYEWTEFLLAEGFFDNRSDAEEWALQLRAEGIGGSLELPSR